MLDVAHRAWDEAFIILILDVYNFFGDIAVPHHQTPHGSLTRLARIVKKLPPAYDAMSFPLGSSMEDWDLELYHQLENHEETPARAFEIVLDTFKDYVETRRQEITNPAESQELRVEIEQAKDIFARFASLHQLPFHW